MDLSRVLSCLFFVLWLSVPPANAELSLCNGVWTNQPCSSGASAKIEEAPVVQSSRPQGLNEKELLYHDLNMKNIEARREYDIRFDIKPIEQLCKNEGVSVEDCRKAVADADDVLEQKIAREKELRLKEARTEQLKRKKEAEEIAPQVTIIEDRTSDLWIPCPYGRCRRRESSSGVSVGAQISGSHGSASVGFGSRTETSEGSGGILPPSRMKPQQGRKTDAQAKGHSLDINRNVSKGRMGVKK